MRWIRNSWMGFVLTLLAAACSEEAPGPGGPDPAIAPFVGTWDAEEFVITGADTVANLLIQGSFDIVIEPSGLYTATLTFGGILTPLVEIGQLSVNGDFITLTPTAGPGPCPAASAYEFTRPDYLVLDGPTCFDFNLDGEDEDAQVHIELQRR